MQEESYEKSHDSGGTKLKDNDNSMYIIVAICILQVMKNNCINGLRAPEQTFHTNNGSGQQGQKHS